MASTTASQILLLLSLLICRARLTAVAAPTATRMAMVTEVTYQQAGQETKESGGAREVSHDCILLHALSL